MAVIDIAALSALLGLTLDAELEAEVRPVLEAMLSQGETVMSAVADLDHLIPAPTFDADV